MSYKDQKQQMLDDAKKRVELVKQAIKVTFLAFSAFLVLFCIAFVWGIISKADSSTILDRRPPTITGPQGDVWVGYVGDNPLYKAMITVSDNADKNPQISVDNSAVDKDTAGSYPVYYTVTDSSGNTSTYTLTYVVKKKEYSPQSLMEIIGERAQELGISADLSDTQKVRKIYSYVHSDSTIKFINESNIPNIDRKNWETDWVEEAVRVLDSKEGDCYSYYSLSKAFFEYFKIENKGIQRAADSEEDGTHFWHVVKVESGWYFYDSTRLGGSFSYDRSKNGCLMTTEKLESYVTSVNGTEFYKMASDQKLPTISSEDAQ